MKIGTRVLAWRETEEPATIVGVHTVLPSGEFAVEIHFDADPEDEIFVYAADGLELLDEGAE